MINSVRLVLQGSLINAATKQEIWNRGKRKNTFYVGFLQQCAYDLPFTGNAHPEHEACIKVDKNLPFAGLLQRVTSSQGQAAIETFKTVLKKPNDQDVAVEIFNTLGKYFCINSNYPNNWRDINELSNYTKDAVSTDGKFVIKDWPESESYIHAIIFLSMISETLLDPIFGVTDSIGSVMRKRISPVTDPILKQLSVLS